MAQSNELGRSQIITKDGILTATVVDKVSPDRLMMMLVRGNAASIFSLGEDETAVVSRDIKDLIVFPFSEI